VPSEQQGRSRSMPTISSDVIVRLVGPDGPVPDDPDHLRMHRAARTRRHGRPEPGETRASHDAATEPIDPSPSPTHRSASSRPFCADRAHPVSAQAVHPIIPRAPTDDLDARPAVGDEMDFHRRQVLSGHRALARGALSRRRLRSIRHAEWSSTGVVSCTNHVPASRYTAVNNGD
jgi:hypothetical protein